jgi:hypothetical protein
MTHCSVRINTLLPNEESGVTLIHGHPMIRNEKVILGNLGTVGFNACLSSEWYGSAIQSASVIYVHSLVLEASGRSPDFIGKIGILRELL